ncbi:MAG TPA: vitamin K epoxide reductase family protein [Candidatus Saccharimonadales bacterium]|nr:vitamin K epoxide reductase family protein [Candidatus Saccharimonadales bacterium]
MFSFGKKKQTLENSNKWIFGTMLVFGLVGLAASFVLAVEEFHLLKNPNAILSCSINTVLNCSTVMETWQASVFGFPNMFIGLMGYPIVVTVAIVALTKAKLPRWFWIVANVCYLLAALFAYWLFFNSVYVIEVLCPWCLIVTFVTTIILATLTHYNLRENAFKLSKHVNNTVQEMLKKDIGKLLTATWIVLLIALVFVKFGESLFA